MAKSRDAFRTISEVSEWLDTPAHVLRFWESKFSQIKPVKRAGGRRYYRPEDMALLAGIKTLLHDQGLTIKGAQKLLREKGIRHVAALGADPREAPDEADGLLIEGTAEEDMAAPEPADPAPRVDPARWVPDDPWPADPVPASEETPAAQGPAIEPPIPEPSVQEPEKVALPFVRARAAARPQPAPTATRPLLPAPPPLPDETAIIGAPGVLSGLARADRAALTGRSAQIAPLAARLRDLAAELARADG